MKNKDILMAAQKEKSKGKEFENKQSVKSNLIGSLIALLVGIMLFLLEYFINSSVNIGLIAVGLTAAAVQSLFEGIKNRKVHMIIIGVVEALVTLFAILAFVSQLVTA